MLQLNLPAVKHEDQHLDKSLEAEQTGNCYYLNDRTHWQRSSQLAQIQSIAATWTRATEYKANSGIQRDVDMPNSFRPDKQFALLNGDYCT